MGHYALTCYNRMNPIYQPPPRPSFQASPVPHLVINSTTAPAFLLSSLWLSILSCS
ncbi:hypothetical protein Scep_007739 [Stephania cephalantha]|uniref:Uncharacterized protein n=1 Tax=Stephania cephalantha TaxID=152367 RepID=A0AAP0KD55_9MAGN